MKLELDKELWLGIPLFTLGAAVSLGLIGPSLVGLDLSTTIIETNGIGFSIARLMSVAALALVVINRDVGLSELGSHTAIEAWVIYVTLGLILTPPFIPVVSGTLLEAPWSIVAFLMQTMGITIISFLN